MSIALQRAIIFYYKAVGRRFNESNRNTTLEIIQIQHDKRAYFPVLALLQRLLCELPEMLVFVKSGESRAISASAGYAWTDNADAEIAELLRHADEALYKVR